MNSHDSSQPMKEIVISSIFLLLLLFVLNPGDLLMPTFIQMCIALGLLIVFAVFATYIWKEKARDEREQLHRLFAGRWAFLIGTGVLVLGIIVQKLHGTLDPWLVGSLGAMVLAKTVGLMWVNKKQ